MAFDLVFNLCPRDIKHLAWLSSWLSQRLHDTTAFPAATAGWCRAPKGTFVNVLSPITPCRPFVVKFPRQQSIRITTLARSGHVTSAQLIVRHQVLLLCHNLFCYQSTLFLSMQPMQGLLLAVQSWHVASWSCFCVNAYRYYVHWMLWRLWAAQLPCLHPWYNS